MIWDDYSGPQMPTDRYRTRVPTRHFIEITNKVYNFFPAQFKYSSTKMKVLRYFLPAQLKDSSTMVYNFIPEQWWRFQLLRLGRSKCMNTVSLEPYWYSTGYFIIKVASHNILNTIRCWSLAANASCAVPPLRFHRVGACWLWTFDCVASFALAVRRSNHSAMFHKFTVVCFQLADSLCWQLQTLATGLPGTHAASPPKFWIMTSRFLIRIRQLGSDPEADLILTIRSHKKSS